MPDVPSGGLPGSPARAGFPWRAPLFLALALITAAAGAWLIARPAGKSGLPPMPDRTGGTVSGSRTGGTVAILVGDAHRSFDADYHLFAEIIAESGWKALPLEPGQAIPETASALAVFGGARLSSNDVARIRGFSDRGGGLLVAAGGVDILASESLSARVRPRDALDDLLGQSGISIGRSLVLDSDAIPAPYETAGGGSSRLYPYHHWFAAEQPGTQPGTGPGMRTGRSPRLFWPSPIAAGKGATVLAKSSSRARGMNKDWVLDPPDVARWFADRAGSDSGGASLAIALEPEGKGRMVVVGSIDFVSALMADTESVTNAEFALAWLAWLSPARTSRDRP